MALPGRLLADRADGDPARPKLVRGGARGGGGRRTVSIAGTATMEIAGARRSGPGSIALLLRPDSFAAGERWAMGGGHWAL